MRVIGLARHSAVRAMAVCRPPSMLTGTLEHCGRGGYSPMRGAILQCSDRIKQIVSFPEVGAVRWNGQPDAGSDFLSKASPALKKSEVLSIGRNDLPSSKASDAAANRLRKWMSEDSGKE